MRRLLAPIAAFLCASTAACVDAGATDEASDAEAEAAPAQLDAKADAPSFAGLYVTHAKAHQDGDLTALQLLASPSSYVRERCYHAGCALPLPETDRYDTYRSAAGKTYLRFWSFVPARDASGALTQTPVVADVYEVVTTSSGIKLRKSYTTRWFSLYRTTAAARCAATGGAWAASACACPAGAGQPPEVFVPGAGGCMARPGADETNCDGSTGLWLDDDASLIGAYCECGLGRYDDATGTCAAI